MPTKIISLAKKFTEQIQDPIQLVAGSWVPGGALLTTLPEIEDYLGRAMQQYFDAAWKNAAGQRAEFIKLLPELFTTRSLVFPNTYKLDLSLYAGALDIYDVLDSNTSTAYIEVWNELHLAEALSGTDPFYTGTATNPGLILQKPNLYLFPKTLIVTPATTYTFDCNVIIQPVDKDTGLNFTINGTNDIPFALHHIQVIADIATNLYKQDDFEADAQQG